MTDHALQLVVKGWRVFPCHEITHIGHCSCNKRGDCSSRGKHPRIKFWQDQATADPDQVVAWWSQWPTANIGIQTGELSRIVVLDFDPRHGGQETLLKLTEKYPEITDTFRVRSGGGGWHLFFQQPAGGSKTCQDILPGMDIRGDGGLVIGPGSIHSSGQPYKIENAADVQRLPDGLLPLVSAEKTSRTYEGTYEQLKSNLGATEEQLKQLSKARSRKKSKLATTPLDLSTLNPSQKAAIVKAIERSLPERPGRRNAQTLMLARRLLSVDGIEKTTDPDSLRPIVKQWYDMAVTRAQELRFTIHGSFRETMDDFRYSFQNARCPMDTAMAGVAETVADQVRGNDLPVPVRQCVDALGYASDRDTTILATLCWHLHHLWELEGFPLATRAAATALECIGTTKPRSHQWVNRTMTHLERDGVVRCLQRVEPGKRGQANTYLWKWTPPAAVPDLGWLTGGNKAPKKTLKTAAEQIKELAEFQARNRQKHGKTSPDI